MPLEREMAARKEYKCHGCFKPIVPGTRYLRVVSPAWEDYDGDVDDEGRSIGYLKDPEDRTFSTLRFHLECEPYGF